MSELIATSAQALEQDAIINLFELDASGFDDGVLRFSNEALNGGSVFFNGFEYFPFPIQMEGFEWNGRGSLPRPTLAISALVPAIRSLILSADDLVGAPIKRIRTYRKHLDDGVDPDPERQWPTEHFVIERKASQTSTTIQFELSVKMDQTGRKIPARQLLRDTCTHRYRYWDGSQFRYDGVTCPYTGDEYYDEAGNQVFQAKDDVCGKRLTDCKLRFGENAQLPTRAFPGVGRY